MNVYVEGGSSHGRSTLKEARDCFCGEINVECPLFRVLPTVLITILCTGNEYRYLCIFDKTTSKSVASVGGPSGSDPARRVESSESSHRCDDHSASKHKPL